MPRPLETSDVELPGEVLALAEFLAENTHDNWAAEKLRQGWRYGPTLDAEARTHPDLVPYACLPERTKDYDRITALQTLRAIVKLGFRIVPGRTG